MATPVEAPNNLVSNSAIRIVDVMGEGPLQGFVQNAGIYGSDPLTSTLYDNVPVRNLDGSYNFNVSGQGYAVYYTLGTSGQLPMPGFDKVENIVPLSSNTQITNPPIGAGNVKNVTATFNTTSYPDADSVKLTINIPDLYTEDQNGNVNGFQLTYAVDISTNNGSFVNIDQITINGKCTSPYLFTTLYTLPKSTPAQAFYQWTLRVRKTSVDILSILTQDTIFVQSIGIISSSSFNYPNTALVGTFIAADQFQTIPNRAYLIDGLQVSVPNGYTPVQYTPGLTLQSSATFTPPDGRNIGMTNPAPSSLAGVYVGMGVSCPVFPSGSTVTYVSVDGAANFGVSQDPTAGYTGLVTFFDEGAATTTQVPAIYPAVWTGDFQTGVWTNNPAWVFYDILTNKRYGLGNYIQPDLIDKWSLYQIAQYCDEFVDAGQNNGTMEPRFSCNVNITNADDAYNVLLNLVSVFRGMMYYANGSIYASQTSDKTPVYAYTNANVVGGQFSYADSARNTRSTVALVRWNDPNNFYRENTAYVEDTEAFLRYGYIEKQAAAYACTSPGQAFRLGQWILTAERTLTETITFQVGLEGIFTKPGDVFNVYDNFRNNQNQGGRIMSFDATRAQLVLDRPVNITAGYNYVMSAIVPTFTLDGSGQVTGSDQISQIQNSQIQTIPITTSAVSGTTTLTMLSGFGTGLYKGSPFILSTTGGGTIFSNAAIYQCISIAETEPGIIAVAGLQYNTGIFALVEQNYNIVPNPINSGDQSPISPPSFFTGTLITGQLAGSNQYYQYLNLTWEGTSSTNLGYYVVSGDEGGPSYGLIGSTKSTFFNYYPDITGKADFVLQAVSQGGVYSTPSSFSYTFAGVPDLDTGQLRLWVLPDGYGDLEQVGVFYNRPALTVSSTRIFFATGVTGASRAPFREVLDQEFYPALGVLSSGITSSGTTAYFTSTSFDMPTMVPQSAIAQGDNTMLLLVENELMSVGGLTGLPNNLYAASVVRGVLGTFGVTHTSNLSGYMFYNADLSSFTDDSLVKVLDATGAYNTGIATRYFQFQNLTQTLNGPIQPAAYPWVPYVLPNPLPQAPTSLAATTPGGPIVHLTWTASPSLDALQYQLYRAVSPFTTFSLVGFESSNTFFDDISVTVGTTYEYKVLTEANNEQTSSFSNVVTVTPPAFPGGVSTTPPSDPTAPVLFSSGYYNADDGSVLIDMTFTLAALPMGAVGQQLYYGPVGAANLMVSNDVTNSGFSTTATVHDMTPGQTYVVAAEAYSYYGVPSNRITGVGSPYLAPSKSVFVAVSAPTNVQVGTVQTNSIPQVPPKYDTSTTPPRLLYAITGSWTPSVDNDISFYEHFFGSVLFPPSSTQAVNNGNTIPVGANFCVFYPPANSFLRMWIRAINRGGSMSSWTLDTNGGGFPSTQYGGTLGAQNLNSAYVTAGQVTNLQVGDQSQPSVTSIVAMHHVSFTYVTVGGSPTELVTYPNINVLGFSAMPTMVVCSVNFAYMQLFYNAFSPGTYPTVALTLSTVDGSNLPPSATVIVNALFMQ